MSSFLIVILLSFTTIGYSQEWESIYSSNDGIEVFFKNQSKNLVWVKTTNVDVDKGDMLNSEIVKGQRIRLIKFNCQDKKMGIIATIEYDNNGEVIFSNQKEEILVDMEYPYPDTFNEFILKKYCNSKK